tara:strand:+ start:1374 stop:1529 length:156 start_codon:yes stop_codon:yes gene_type:complete
VLVYNTFLRLEKNLIILNYSIMDYREYKIMMAEKDPAYKFMSDAELLKKYE